MTDDSRPIEPSRPGKGAGHVIPNTTNLDGPLIVHDPKPTIPDWGAHLLSIDPNRRPEWRGADLGKGVDQ